jgi:hypothetical protein
MHDEEGANFGIQRDGGKLPASRMGLSCWPVLRLRYIALIKDDDTTSLRHQSVPAISDRPPFASRMHRDRLHEYSSDITHLSGLEFPLRRKLGYLMRLSSIMVFHPDFSLIRMITDVLLGPSPLRKGTHASRYVEPDGLRSRHCIVVQFPEVVRCCVDIIRRIS